MAIQHFNANVMIEKYEKYFYLPAAKCLTSLIADNAKEAEMLAAQRERLRALWSNIRVEHPVQNRKGPFIVGDRFSVTSVVNLGELHPDEVITELYYGSFGTRASMAPRGATQVRPFTGQNTKTPP